MPFVTTSGERVLDGYYTEVLEGEGPEATIASAEFRRDGNTTAYDAFSGFSVAQLVAFHPNPPNPGVTPADRQALLADLVAMEEYNFQRSQESGS